MSQDKIEIPSPIGKDQEAEHRRDLRVPLRVLRVQTEIQGDMFFGYARNLSATGMFIQTSNPKESGLEVDLSFALAPSKTTICCKAKVIWIRNYTGKDRAEPGMGLRFTEISADNAETIRKYVKELSA